MAAGLGSRFGGVKQLAAVGPDGEVILEQAARTRELLGDSHLALATAERSIEHAFERTLWIEGPWALIRRVRRQCKDASDYRLPLGQILQLKPARSTHR